MPRSKNYLTYPDSFTDFIKLAVTKRVEVELNNAKEAKTLMGRMYGFFAALEAAAKARDTPEEIRELRRMSTKVKLRVSDSTLIAIPADEEPMAKLVAEAVRDQSQAGDVQPQSDIRPGEHLLKLLREEAEKHDE